MSVLILRTSNHLHQSYGNFQHPTEVGKFVKAPDWNPRPVCGGGIHGWLWGEGNGGLGDWTNSAVWQVYSVKPEDLVDLEGKVKFRRGKLVCVGDRKAATDYVLKRAPGKAVVGAFVTVGNNKVAVTGYGGTATAGERGTATAGYGGTATAGDDGTATAGERGTATAGDDGTATAGERGTATAGYYGTATAGERGTATAGERGTATAGERGTATAGYGGTAAAGQNGIIRIAYFCTRLRWKVGYIGEDGLMPNVKYQLDKNNNFVAVTNH